MKNFKIERYQNTIRELSSKNEALEAELRKCKKNGLAALADSYIEKSDKLSLEIERASAARLEYQKLLNETLALKQEYEQLVRNQKKLMAEYQNRVHRYALRV